VICESKFTVGEIKLRRDWIEREEAAKWRERERERERARILFCTHKGHRDTHYLKKTSDVVGVRNR
jgi:hypothetical protein